MNAGAVMVMGAGVGTVGGCLVWLGRLARDLTLFSAGMAGVLIGCATCGAVVTA